jgi:hypothetical protein
VVGAATTMPHRQHAQCCAPPSTAQAYDRSDP